MDMVERNMGKSALEEEGDTNSAERIDAIVKKEGGDAEGGSSDMVMTSPSNRVDPRGTLSRGCSKVWSVWRKG